MVKLIVLTDLHLLPEGGTIIGIDPLARLAAAIDHINRHHADAAQVIITGDLTHLGDPASYHLLRQQVSRLVPPVSMTLGNHDRRDIFRQVFPEAPVDENGFVQLALDLAGTRVILLDTVHERPEDHPELHAGSLSPERLAWFDRQLAAAGGRPALVFMHHPPHDTGFAGMDSIKLLNGDAFYAVAERHGNVRHIFAGHVHRTIGGSHRGIPFSIFKSTAHQQPMPFSITASSASVDEPGAYGILALTPHGLQVHTEDFTLSSLPVGHSSDA